MMMSINQLRNVVCSSNVLITRFFMKESDTLGIYLTHEMDTQLCLTKIDADRYKISIVNKFTGLDREMAIGHYIKPACGYSLKRHVIAVKGVDEIMGVVGGKMFDTLYNKRMGQSKGRIRIAKDILSFNSHLKSGMIGDLLNNPDQKENLDKALIPYRHFYCFGDVDKDVLVNLVN